MPGQTVLLVEPDEDTRLAVREALTAAGYEVMEASTSEEGVWHFRADHPDAVIASYPLYLTRGDSLVTVFRQLALEEGRELPIIALTREDMRLDGARAALDGADEQCPRSTSPRVLTAVVRALLRSAG